MLHNDPGWMAWALSPMSISLHLTGVRSAKIRLSINLYCSPFGSVTRSPGCSNWRAFRYSWRTSFSEADLFSLTADSFSKNQCENELTSDTGSERIHSNHGTAAQQRPLEATAAHWRLIHTANSSNQLSKLKEVWVIADSWCGLASRSETLLAVSSCLRWGMLADQHPGKCLRMHWVSVKVNSRNRMLNFNCSVGQETGF